MSFRDLGWILGLLLLGLWACTPSERSSETAFHYTDDLGRTVTLPHWPRRVVTLAPSLTEIVFAAGAGHLLVGVTTADDYPPAVDTLPRFSALPVNFEAIVALKPDLVLATDQVNNPRDTATFATLGLPVYFFSYATLEDVLEAILTTGRMLGTEAAAKRTVDSLRARLLHLQAALDPLPRRPSVLLLISDETLYAFGQGSYVHDLIARAGGQSLTATLPVAGPVLSDEFVLQAKPEVIVVTMGTDYEPSRLLQRHPSWDVVPAVSQGRICGLEPSWILRPGPRLIAGLEALAHCLHPDLVTVP
ncbi:ABC transporter substrate-binding protein [Rhodothermus bifroesti]|uniref:ABC transporter substrate-binding protein n=1 Tax=Rhodothermus marinus TaxID=29549 RepID=A0A7V2F5P0_RHOMR|nr:helical backbone metal receptor [Rhodothermus bifroesti]GBD00693.1 Vitamin B12-binding protein [bacterium HR18]